MTTYFTLFTIRRNFLKNNNIARYKKGRKEHLVNRGWGIEWFTITKLGKKIFGGIRY